MKGENQGAKYQDITLSSTRHPIIVELETALIVKKPVNPVHFIKSWAMKQLKEVGESQEEEETSEMKVAESKKKSMHELLRRRGAIVMTKYEESQHWKQFFLKDQLYKNEECKSRIMIGLRSVPFLYRFEWEDINYLVQLGEVREYYQSQIFVSKGQMIDRLFILILGQIKRHNITPPSTLYSEGSYLFAESLISSLKTASSYVVTSEKAWICGIDAYAIHQRLREANKKREEQLQRILMNVSLFSCLDHEEMYKLVLMVKELPPFKADTIVLEKDEQINRLFLVIKGEFSLCRKNLSGEITALQTFREGQAFDEEWIRNKTRAQVAVISKTDGILNYIEQQSIEEGITKIEHLILRKRQKKNGK